MLEGQCHPYAQHYILAKSTAVYGQHLLSGIHTLLFPNSLKLDHEDTETTPSLAHDGQER